MIRLNSNMESRHVWDTNSDVCMVSEVFPEAEI